MCRILISFLVIYLLVGLTTTTQAQSRAEKDSLRFQPLIDDIILKTDEEKLDAAIQVAGELLKEAKKANSDKYIIRAYYLRYVALNRREAYDVEALQADLRACFDLSTAVSDYPNRVGCAKGLAITFFNISQYDSAKVYFQIVMETARDHFPERYLISITNMAFIYGVMDNRQKEVEYYLMALNAARENPEYDNVNVRTMAYSGIGDYYRSINEFEKAIEYYQAKLKLAEENNLIRAKYEALYGLAKIYEHGDFYDFEKSQQYYQVVANDTTRALEVYRYRSAMGLAKLYIEERKFAQSQELLKDARLFYKQSNSNDYVSNAEELLALSYYELNDKKEARIWAEMAVKSARMNGLISREKKALFILYRLDSLEGRYKDAFLNFQRHQAINDSLNNLESLNKLNELQVKYETEQTTRQNEKLKTSLELEELRSQGKNTIIISVGAVSVVLVVSMVLIYRNYNRKKRDHDIIASQAAELRQLSDFKEGLTGMVVHDMKNPINSIIGFSRGTPDEKKMKKINQSGYNILNLVTNMLDIQRFEEARVEVITESVDAHKLVANAGNEVHLLLQAKSLRFKNQVPKGVSLKAERALLDRVMVNLLTNAIKYSKSGAEVRVGLGKEVNGFIEIMVEDTGEGISPEKLPFVFDKFWHRDARKSGLAPSTGLGLSFCKLAIEAHGGSIRAQSKLAVGTSMIFTIPLSAEGMGSYEHSLRVNEDDLENSLMLEDSDLLKTYAHDLQQLKVYQVSAINKIISDLEVRGLDANWIMALQAAVYQGDQDKYDELITKGITDKTI